MAFRGAEVAGGAVGAALTIVVVLADGGTDGGGDCRTCRGRDWMTRYRLPLVSRAAVLMCLLRSCQPQNFTIASTDSQR